VKGRILQRSGLFVISWKLLRTWKLKKLLPIAFVTLVLLNTMGYYLVFIGMAYKNDVMVTEQLDAFEYQSSDAMTIKIPLAVPYLADDAEFIRVEGKYVYEGESYRMVKQKYSQDTLYIVCVKDQQDKLIHNAISDYVKGFTHKASDRPNNGKTILLLNKDYIQNVVELNSSTPGWMADVVKNSCYINIVATYSPAILHPPERS